ncbi:hypothetical protein Aduo_008916 [Ancylostoma duodenale]
MCPTDLVIFHPANGPYTTDALSESLPKNPQGCRRMNAVCMSESPTDNSFMEFNNGIGGPYVAPTVKAELVCHADQKWYYSDGTTSLTLANNAQGCKQMNAVCESGSATDTSEMEVQYDIFILSPMCS